MSAVAGGTSHFLPGLPFLLPASSAARAGGLLGAPLAVREPRGWVSGTGAAGGSARGGEAPTGLELGREGLLGAPLCPPRSLAAGRGLGGGLSPWFCPGAGALPGAI